MTLIWFAVWLIANVVGEPARLTADPVNVWTGTLLLAVALDLGSRHASDLGRSRPRERRD